MRTTPAKATRPVLACLALTFVCVAFAQGTTGPRPNSSLAPDEVVRIQLEALRSNDASDGGIDICFRFASPSNKRMTGPLERFAVMIKRGQYALMLDYLDADYGPLQVGDRLARQVVTLTGRTQAVTYTFWLTKQDDGECKDCWMTDAVVVERVVDAT